MLFQIPQIRTITLRSFTSPSCSTKPRGQDLCQSTTVCPGGEIQHYRTRVRTERTLREAGMTVSDRGSRFHVLNPSQRSIGHVWHHCWATLSAGILPCSQVSATYLKIGHPKMESTGARSSDELQWLDLVTIWYRGSSTVNGHQSELFHWYNTPNMSNAKEEILRKATTSHFTQGSVLTKSCLFCLSWATTSIERPLNYVLALYRVSLLITLTAYKRELSFTVYTL